MTTGSAGGLFYRHTVKKNAAPNEKSGTAAFSKEYLLNISDVPSYTHPAFYSYSCSDKPEL